MWREFERKLHMKIIAIGKSLAEGDMIDSDTTGKEQKQLFFLLTIFLI